MAGVGTQKVFEDDQIIVWHLDLEPGEQGERHTHELDYVIRILSGSTLEVSGPNGELLDTVELEAGGGSGAPDRFLRWRSGQLHVSTLQSRFLVPPGLRRR